MKKIEKLVRKNATEAGTWEPTHYTSLRQARQLNPGEYPNHFRIATGERTGVIVSDLPIVHKTRFTELGYWNLGPGCWQCVDLTGDRPAQIGIQYVTKAELLANLEAYATEYGCDGANPKPSYNTLLKAAIAEQESRPTPFTFDQQITLEKYFSVAPNPASRQYEGQAHYMSKAAQSLVNMLNSLDYSSFDEEESTRLTRSIHSLIMSLEGGGSVSKPETYPVTRSDGRAVQVTVPERE